MDIELLIPITKQMCDSSIGLMQSTIQQLKLLERSGTADDLKYLHYLVKSCIVDVSQFEQTISEYKEQIRIVQEGYFNDPEELDADYSAALAHEEYFAHAAQIITDYKKIIARYADTVHITDTVHQPIVLQSDYVYQPRVPPPIMRTYSCHGYSDEYDSNPPQIDLHDDVEEKE